MNDIYRIRVNSTSLADAYLQDIPQITDTIRNTLDSLVLPSFPPEAFDAIRSSLLIITEALHDSLWPYNSDSLRDICQQLANQFKTITIPSFEMSSILNDISIDKADVILTDDAVEKLTDFFAESTENPAAEITNKMSRKDFVINVLLPLILCFLPMIQSSYYRHVDSIESQQQQLQESTFQAQLLDIESQQLEEEKLQTEYLKQLIHLLEDALAEVPEVDQESFDQEPSVPHQSPDIPQESVPVLDVSVESVVVEETVPDLLDDLCTDE